MTHTSLQPIKGAHWSMHSHPCSQAGQTAVEVLGLVKLKPWDHVNLWEQSAHFGWKGVSDRLSTSFDPTSTLPLFPNGELAASLQYTLVCRSTLKTKHQWCDIAPPHRSFAVSSQCGHHMCGLSWEAKKMEWGDTKQVLNPHAVLRLLFSYCNWVCQTRRSDTSLSPPWKNDNK